MNLPNILVLCTGNSCRSQMAEGLFRHLAGDQFTVHSAGTDPKPDVHPLAIEVMREIGIDISKQRPKDIKEFLGRLAMGYLIIVCDKANDSCPRIFPGRWERLFWPFEDPAEFRGSRDDTLAKFRHVRDEIKAAIVAWLRELRPAQVPGV
ncbi:MAG: arsenate reductase ArsC [Pirellulaceae bacterium]